MSSVSSYPASPPHTTRPARPGVQVTIPERSSLYGGRADITEDGKHCARLFLGDYHYLLGLFREIPGVDGTMLDSTHRCRRFDR
ncbi:hypothetical protein [Kutzneria sp. NPDC051319]|uniref:hypothetical protein n=1 Tax=Kutzneria sp. NPDC051319 TaxID=3155047 RepID=UPI003443C089